MSSNFVSYLADLTDPTFATADINLNAYETGLGPFETDSDSLDLGAPEMDGVWLNEAGKDEDVLSAHRRGRVEASFNLRIGPSSSNTFTTMQTNLRKLNAALDRSGVWVLQQPGQGTPLYIDYYPSPLSQQLMPGQRSMYFLWTALQQPNGMRVTILRRPKMRVAALDATRNMAHNVLLAEDHDADGVPTFWQWEDDTGITAQTYDWTYGAHQATFNTGASRFFYQDSDAAVVEVAHTYTFSMSIAASYTVKPTVKARIDWLDSDGDLISTTYGTAMPFIFSPRLGFSRASVLGAVAPTDAVTARYGIEVTPVSTATVIMYLRDAQFEIGLAANTFRPGFETISQNPGDPFYKRIWMKTDGNADALGQLRATPSVDREVARMVYARRSGERDSSMAMRILPGWSAVLSTELQHGTASYTDAGRSVAKTALTDDVLRAVLRQEVVQAEESALRGTWRLRGALRGDLNDAYLLQVRYGLGDVTDLPFSMLRRRLDLTGPPSESDYYEVDFGLFRVPTGSQGVYFELFCARDTTEDGDMNGELYLDQFWIEPADDDLYASAEVPGAQRPQHGPITETILGKNFVTPPDGLAEDPDTSGSFVAGTVYNDDMLLNDTLEAASIKAGVTDELTAGVQHTFALDVLMFTNEEKVARKHGEFRIHNMTTDTQVKMITLKNDPGVPWSAKTFTLRLVPAAATEYLVYVVQTVDVAVGNIHVQKITHSFVPPVNEGGDADTIAVDADQRRAYVLNAADQFKAALDLTPPFPLVMPKVQLYRVSFAGLGPDGSDDVLDGGPALSHDPDLTALVGIHTVPRYFN